LQNIFITGGFGNLGSHLAKYLSSNKYRVILGTRKDVSSPEWCRDAEVIKIDWSNLSNLSIVLSKIDTVIHAAGMNAKNCKIDPDRANTFNCDSTLKLIQLSKLSGVKKFLFFSTSNVYSDKLEGDINEDTPTLGTSPYSLSKLVGERQLLQEANKNFHGIVLRLSNIFGAPLDTNMDCWDLIINNLTKEVIESNTLTLRGQKNDQRDFLPINVFCNYIFHIIRQNYGQKKIINIGSGKSYTVNEIVKFISNLHYSNSKKKCEEIYINEQSKKKLIKLNYSSKYFIRTDTLNNDEFKRELNNIYKYCLENFSQ